LLSFEFYKGSLEGCLISVKKYKGEFLWDFEVEDTIKDFVVGTQMSVHKNVLKLLASA